MEQTTPSEIDAAFAECLRIFARRGRQLREEQERTKAQRAEESHAEQRQDELLAVQDTEAKE